MKEDPKGFKCFDHYLETLVVVEFYLKFLKKVVM